MSGLPRRALLLAVALTASAWAGTPEGPRVRLTPHQIEMGSFYSGAQLRIEGHVSEGAEAIVVVRGPDQEQVFNHKARFGFIWATAGKVRISGVPSLFLCFSTRPVEALLSRSIVRERHLDQEAIRSEMRVEGESGQDTLDAIRSDFLKLKQERELYRVVTDGVTMGEPCEDGTPFSAELSWPKAAPPASYTVKVLECREGRVTGESSLPLEVVKVGFPQSFAIMAEQHASLYGALAVFVAVLAGFSIDFLCARLFGGRRRTSH